MKWCVLSILLLLQGPLGASNSSEARSRFLAAFRSDKPAQDRLAAVEMMALHDTKDSAKLLLSGIPVSHEIFTALTERRAGVRDGRITGFPDGDPNPELMRLKELIDRELRVLSALDGAVAALRSPRSVTWLFREALLREKHWRARQAVAAALASIADPDSVKYLRKALSDKDARVRAAVVLALGDLKAEAVLEDLIEAMEDRAWAVRAAAIQALQKIGGAAVIEPLIDRMEKEEGRLEKDCVQALKELTGQRFGAIPGAWRRWWAENAETFGGSEKPDKPDPDDEGYYGIPVHTDRAIFIIDISESMSYSAVEWQEKPKPGELSRLELAKREFIRALTTFNSKGRFNIIVFNDVVITWKKGMVASDEKTKESAKRWIKRLKATSTTNIYGALETAFQIAGMGAADKHYDLQADTVYLLSDGAPTNEDFSDDDPMKIIRAVREWNRMGRIRIHTIGMKGHDVAFMSRLARENGGRYVAR